ncbi:MAG TPA: sialidase family protein [Solirubrobacterales bacterium]|nr:sialidase family protein [Solirubrobacterales bacterium]
MGVAGGKQEKPDEQATQPITRPPASAPPSGSRLIWSLVSLALVLAGVGALIVSGSYDEPVEIEQLGRSLPVNEGARNALDLSGHNSPELIRNPVDEANLVSANRIDEPRYSCALNVSFDGGGRWNQTPIPVPPGEEPKCYAPDVAFDADGILYMSYVTLAGAANAPNAVWLVRSRDGGRTLSRPTEIAPLGPNSFTARLSADPDQPGLLYLTWLDASDLGLYRFSEPGNPIKVIRSEDGGRSWSEPVRVSGTERERVVAPSPATGPDGELYVLYLDLGDDRLDYHGEHRGRGGPPYAGPWQLVLARSTDGGESWEESVVEEELTPSERFIVFTPPYPAIAVDQDTGRVYAGFQDAREGDPDVYVWSLESDGDEWEGPVRVNDTEAGDGSAQYRPALAVAPDGRLDVVYYDRREDSKDILNEVSYQASFDEGESFSERVPISDESFSSRIGFGSNRGLAELGSRLGLVSTDDRALAVWSDTRAGTLRTGKQDIARGLVGISDPPRLADWLEFVLRWGGIALIVAGVAVFLLLALRLGRGGRSRPGSLSP